MSAKWEYHRPSFCLGQNGENYDDPSASTANLFLVTFHDLEFSFNGARGAASCMCVCVCVCVRACACAHNHSHLPRLALPSPLPRAASRLCAIHPSCARAMRLAVPTVP